jgi:hypothetical protein
LVVMMTAELEVVGAGVIVPVTCIVACPEYDDALVERVMDDAAKATVGPRTRTAASRTVASVLSVFISYHRVAR